MSWIVVHATREAREGLGGACPGYYSETGWQSDITHATRYRTRDEAEKIAFSIVTADPSQVGYVSVEENSST